MPKTTTKMTPAKAERIMRNAFRIAGEDGSISGYGTSREIETAEFMCAESLRRLQARCAAADMLAALKALFKECTMTHKHWGEGDNSKEAKAAIASAQAAIAAAEGSAAATTPADPTADDLVIVLEGGLVQCVVGTGGAVGRKVHIIDYDTDGAGDDELSEIGQEDGSTTEAYYRTETVTPMTITLPVTEGR